MWISSLFKIFIPLLATRRRDKPKCSANATSMKRREDDVFQWRYRRSDVKIFKHNRRSQRVKGKLKWGLRLKCYYAFFLVCCSCAVIPRKMEFSENCLSPRQQPNIEKKRDINPNVYILKFGPDTLMRSIRTFRLTRGHPFYTVIRRSRPFNAPFTARLW